MEKKELKKELFEKYNWDRFFTEKVKEDVWEWVEDKLDKAREEGFNDGVEKTVGIIQKELDELLLEKDDEKFWVGDILRDCGYSVESILPKNMKGYLVKLKDNK